MLAPVFHLAFSERDHNKTNPVSLLLIGTKSLKDFYVRADIPSLKVLGVKHW